LTRADTRYSEQEPNWRRFFESTRAHNTVTVDGLDQTPYRRGKPKTETACGRPIGRVKYRVADSLRVVYRAAVAGSPAIVAARAYPGRDPLF
jgi:hypothetical protein